MTFEIRKDKKVIGFTELEFGDPPMGFVYGTLKATSCYQNSTQSLIMHFLSVTEIYMFSLKL